MREAVATQNSSLWLTSFVAYEMRSYALQPTRFSCSNKNMIRSYQYICLVWQKPKLFFVALTFKCIAGFSINQIYWHNFDFKLTSIILVYEKLINFTSDIVVYTQFLGTQGAQGTEGSYWTLPITNKNYWKRFKPNPMKTMFTQTNFMLWFIREFLPVWEKCT